MTGTRRASLGGALLCAWLAAGPGLPTRGVAQAQPPAPVAPAAVFLPSKSTPLVAVRFVFRVGSQDDPPGKEGLAALTASMLAEGGTQELTYDQILTRFYPMAGALSGSCHKEATVFSGEIHRDNLAAYEAVATAMLTKPRFAREDFERLRNEAIDYVSKTLRGNNDEELGKWTLQLALYQGQPYGHVDRGTVQGLKSIMLDDVKAFYKAHYARGSLLVGVAGGAEKSFLERLDKALAPLPARGTPPAPRGIL